jgi:hypothetical protein
MSHSTRKVALAVLTFLLAGIILNLPVSQAAPLPLNSNNVTLEFKAGFDGHYKENNWLPLQITLSSTGQATATINGRLEASFSNFAIDSLIYQRDVSLNAPFRKNFWIYMIGPRSVRNVQVRLVSREGAVLAEAAKDINPLGDSNFLVGVISDDGSALNYLNNIDLAQPPRSTSAYLYNYYGNNTNTPLTSRSRATIAHLSPTDLPPNPAGLYALDAMIIGDLTTTVLGTGGSDPEILRTTVAGWLASGKALVVAGDSGLRKVGSLATLLPVTAASGPKFLQDTAPLQNFAQPATGPVSGSTLNNLSIADVKLATQTGASVLLTGTASEPLVVTRGYGLGTSWFLATEMQSLKSWSLAQNFWQAVFKDYLPRLDYASAARRSAVGNDWSYRVTPNPEIKERFDLLGLIIYLSIYIVLIGPIAYLLLKRLDRRELAWVVIPVLGFGFTAAAYFINSGGLDKDMVVSRAAVIILGQGSDGDLRGVSTGLATIYSNKRNEFNLVIGEEALFSSSFGDRNYVTYANPNNSSNLYMPLVIKQGVDGGYRGIYLGVQQRRSFGFEQEANRQQAGGIQAEVRFSNGRLEGTLQNTTNRDWEDVAIFIPGGAVHKIGLIKAGERKSIPVETAVPGKNLVETLVNTSSEELLNYNYRGNLSYPVGLTKLRRVDGRLVQDPDYHRAVLLETIFGMGGDGLSGGNNRFYLVGWSKNASLPFQIESRNVGNYDLTLLMEGLSYQRP